MLSAPRFSRMINRPSPSSRRKATAQLLRVFSVVASLLVYGDCAPASFVVEKAAFSILGPDNLKGTFDSAIGDFGGGPGELTRAHGMSAPRRCPT